jgi:hypothetical protein
MSHPSKHLSACQGYIEVSEAVLSWDSHFEWTEERGAAHYRIQSNGSAFSDDQPLAVDDLVKVENNTIQALVPPPDFKPLLRDITGQESLEIEVKYAPTVASKPQEPPTAPRPDGGDDEDDENDADE